MFQDQEIPLTFKGWQKKANEDIAAKGGKQAISWKQRLKYQLRYSYPEFALDEAGEQIIDVKTGNPMRNKHYDPKYPHGYSISYFFEEGVLESGSLPLFNCFCLVQPQPGEVITINRTGEGQETKWKVKRVTKGEVHASQSDVPDIDFSSPEYSGDPDINNEVSF